MSTTTAPEQQAQPWRLWVIYGVVALVLGSLLFRLVSLQVLQGTDWHEQAVENYTTIESIAPSRGIIYDRNGFILARNVASYNLTMTPAELPDDDADIQRIYRGVSGLTGIPVNSGTLDEAKLFGPCVEGPGIAQRSQPRRRRATNLAASVVLHAGDQRLDGPLVAQLSQRRRRRPCHAPDRKRWFLLTATALGGRHGGAVVSHTDISAPMELSDRLKVTNERLALAQESAGAGVWDWDMRSGTLEWSNELFRLFGPADDAPHRDRVGSQTHPFLHIGNPGVETRLVG